MVSCGSQPQTLSELESEYVTIDDSIRVHYKIMNSQADAKTICFVHGFGCGSSCRMATSNAADISFYL